MSLYTPSQETIKPFSALASLASRSLEEFIEETLAITIKQLPDCARVCLWMRGEGAQKRGFHRVAQLGLSQDQSETNSGWLESDFPAFFSALHHQPLIDASQAQVDSRTVELSETYLQPLKIQALLCVPIHFENQVVGVLCAEYRQYSEWSAELKQLLVEVAGLLGLVHSDVRHKALLERQKHVFQVQNTLIDNAPDAIFLLNDGCIINANEAATQLFGADSAEQLLGLMPAELSPVMQDSGERSDIAAESIITSVLSGQYQRYEWKHQRLDGQDFYTEVTLSRLPGKNMGVIVGLMRDLTPIKQQQEKLNSLAYGCALTGLANRQASMEFCSALLDQEVPNFTLLSIDLNNFKSINQSLGTAAGDAVLCQVARRLQDFFGGSDNVCIARVGGNEFAVILTENSNKMKLRLQAEKLRKQLESPIAVEDMQLSIGVTIAICEYPEDGRSIDQLLRSLSMTQEYARSRFSPIMAFSKSHDDPSEVRRLLITQLERAIDYGELSLFYQPKIDLQSRRCTSFEALIRWKHPEKGLVPPDQFIPQVEKTRLITPLTRWVIRTACQQLQSWLPLQKDLSIAVNLSTRNLLDQNLPGFIQQQLDEFGLAPEHLHLEITESSMMADPERALKTLHALHDLGTPLVIDDYGTGHSSLAYLRSLPVQTLKVDRTFICEVQHHSHDRIIVESIITLAHNLNLSVVAEGVEDDESLNYLADIGCDAVQGYVISRPLPAEEAANFLGIIFPN